MNAADVRRVLERPELPPSRIYPYLGRVTATLGGMLYVEVGPASSCQAVELALGNLGLIVRWASEGSRRGEILEVF